MRNPIFSTVLSKTNAGVLNFPRRLVFRNANSRQFSYLRVRESGIGEWQFVIPWGLGKLKPIPRVLGSGSICFRFEVNLEFIYIEKNFLWKFFLLTYNHWRTGRGRTVRDFGERVPWVPHGILTCEQPTFFMKVFKTFTEPPYEYLCMYLCNFF